MGIPIGHWYRRLCDRVTSAVVIVYVVTMQWKIDCARIFRTNGLIAAKLCMYGKDKVEIGFVHT